MPQSGEPAAFVAEPDRIDVDPAKVRGASLGGFAVSTILRQHAPRMV